MSNRYLGNEACQNWHGFTQFESGIILTAFQQQGKEFIKVRRAAESEAGFRAA
jgi:hypothetical protein